MPDRVNPGFGEVSRFKLPASAMIDFRTISIFADVTLYAAGTMGAGSTYALHLPRNTYLLLLLSLCLDLFLAILYLLLDLLSEVLFVFQ